MDEPVIHVIALIGPAGVGKSTLALAVAERTRLRGVDIDREFEARYGSIELFGRKHGWQCFFSTESMMLRDTVRSFHRRNELCCVATPASCAWHSLYISECVRNVLLLRHLCFVVCVLASDDHHVGAQLAFQREVVRGYDVQEGERIERYATQARVYASIADAVVFTEAGVQAASMAISECLKEVQSTDGARKRLAALRRGVLGRA